MERLATAVSLSNAVHELARVAIREKYPEATEQEQKRLLAARLYGRDVADRLFAPHDAR
jgi:hypothetical protein